ncbi:GNAT family N-acetyltransferase [Microbacterium tenebrionis]|uniref:GNAT family N-acetyltransferase n=1 Tax=Microbacterium tenebrionis TaxID=2830665 RepID=A0A9X1LM04_9MICO|nr:MULTISPECIES: GNAT family N-acetyltransferase [Microbacterium]MCC2028118.1 GNAT family N-acetyltransferase [Microbacterium tenebrionis]
MIVRPAVPADADGVAEVHVRSWQAAYRDLMPQEVLDGLSVEQRAEGWRGILGDMSRASRTLVAEHEGRIVGWASFGAARDADAPGTGELWGIYALPESWSSGIGHAMIAAVERELIDAGHATAYLWVLDGNERAAAFYERHGWNADGGAKVEERPGLVLHERRHTRALTAAPTGSAD